MAHPIYAFLRGDGPDGRSRRLADVLGFDDDQIESTHDFIQWVFPLPEPSRAVPGAPVLGAKEAAAIRADPRAQDGMRAALARMTRFYARADGWLTAFDHNHLRITRIIAATRNLLGKDAAAAFHAAILARHEAAGRPINPDSLRRWQRALG